MSTSPGSTFEAMALTSPGPEELDDPELPLPVLPVFPELPDPPKTPPFPNGDPLPKGLPEEPEPPEPFPAEPEGEWELPDVGLKACVVGVLPKVAWPMPMPAPKTASAAAPASRPLRTRWVVLPVP